MKKLVLAVATALVSLMAWAQTPEEILEKMTEAMNHDESEGMIMTVSMKVPILGTFGMRAYTLGDKSRVEMKAMGKELVTWSDGVTSWEYDSKDNTITIRLEKPGEPSDAQENMNMVNGVTEGYDVKLLKETDEAWFFRCDKQKTNKDKDDPKRIDISVYKGTYYLREMSTTMKGVTMIIKSIEFGVKEEDVTFDISRFKGAKIVDKRGEEKKQQ